MFIDFRKTGRGMEKRVIGHTLYVPDRESNPKPFGVWGVMLRTTTPPGQAGTWDF